MSKPTRYLTLVALFASCTNVLAGPFQNGQSYANTAVAPGGTISNAFGSTNNAVNQLNSGIGIVQPNGQTVLNMQNNGVLGNANGTGLGSFGTANVTRCAGYIPGSGGPTQDAECGAVNFASQQTNINAQAKSAYGLTANSSMFTNANSAVSGAASNQSSLLPGTGTTATGGQTCTTTPGVTQNTTQSCYVYAQQATGGGTVSTYGAGTSINVTCTGGANITATSCTVTPTQTTHTASCLSSSTNAPSGTSSVYQVGSQANVTCDSGASITTNQCTVNPAQATHNAACYATTNTAPTTGQEGFYLTGASANVSCIVGANLGATSCTVNPPQATHSALCQKSVPVNRTCNQIASANVTSATRSYCVSGNYPIHDVGCAWGGWIGAWWTYPVIGYASVVCTGQYTFNLTANVNVGGEVLMPNGPLPLAYGSAGSTTTDVASSTLWQGTHYVYVVASVTWDGSSSFSFRGSNGGGAWCGKASIPIGTQSYLTATPTFSDGCATWANM